MASTNGHPAYRLRIRKRAAVQIEELRDRAIARRVAKSFGADIEAALVQLVKNPFGWGDSLTDYKQLDAVRRRGRSTFLYVYYSVDPKLRTVQVYRVRIHPLGPLA